MDEATVNSITIVIDYTTIIAGIGTIAALLVIVLIAIKGAKYLLHMVSDNGVSLSNRPPPYVDNTPEIVSKYDIERVQNDDDYHGHGRH